MTRHGLFVIESRGSGIIRQCGEAVCEVKQSWRFRRCMYVVCTQCRQQFQFHLGFHITPFLLSAVAPNTFSWTCNLASPPNAPLTPVRCSNPPQPQPLSVLAMESAIQSAFERWKTRSGVDGAKLDFQEVFVFNIVLQDVSLA